MDIKTLYTKEPFNNLFKECYYMHLDNKEGAGQIPVIDDCCYDFIFFKEASGIFYFSEAQKAIRITSKVFTVHNVTPPYRIKATDSLTFFTLKVQPWANAHFFSSLQKPGIIDLTYSDEGLTSLHKQLFDPENKSNRFNMAKEFMKTKQIELTSTMRQVREICEKVYEEKGKITVYELSENFGVSRQYLTKIFKKEVMYPLKKFIITVRILDLVKFRAKHPNVSLTQLSHDYGYFDQSHFINDFKKICGVKPLHFFNNLPEFILRHR
ncbi:MAG: helix-turn-helix transcriptional regulator [Algicola sp.]|nr:helix-turn-helix transcriptional regulator [Algicola sp.]